MLRLQTGLFFALGLGTCLSLCALGGQLFLDLLEVIEGFEFAHRWIDSNLALFGHGVGQTRGHDQVVKHPHIHQGQRRLQGLGDL